MAEFTEIMYQAKRMCTAHDSYCIYDDCPLADGEECRLNVNMDGEDYNELECIIMDWAKEHPEPVYPSWADGWAQLFPEAAYVPCPDQYFGYDSRCERYGGCNQCKASPMPADIAERLGIKPMGGNRILHPPRGSKGEDA